MNDLFHVVSHRVIKAAVLVVEETGLAGNKVS